MQRRSQGDTIIEVVLAFAIFSLAAVGTISLINSGLATTQRNLETTLVRQQIDSQAELLRYLRDTGDTAWDSIIAPGALVSTPAALSDSCQAVGAITQGFYVQPIVAADPASTTYTRRSITPATLVDPVTYAKIDYSTNATESQGIWIQATKAQEQGPGSVAAYDFYIHACWDSVGVDEPMTLGTIVRIYE
jgi:type II secretory pathway pseudopilin PulG